MIPPHAATNRHAQVGGRAGHTEFTRSRSAATPVKPAVRPPPQSVGEIVIIGGRDVESIQHHFRRAIGNSITILVWKKKQLRWTHRPHAAATDFNTGEP